MNKGRGILMYALNIPLVKIKGFKFYIVLSGFFKGKLELFAIHFVRPSPYKSIIYLYDFIDKKSQLIKV